MEGKKSTSKFAIIAGILFAILALWYLKDELQWMSSEYYSFDIWCWLYIIACAAFAVFLLLRKRGSYAVAPAALLVLAVLIYSVSDLSLPDLFEWLFSLEWFEYYYWFEYLMLLLLFLMRVLANSTYQEIYEIHMMYIGLSEKEREKVENLSVLAEYCDPTSGDFVLTKDMVVEMSEMFDSSFTEKLISIHFNTSKEIKSACSDWNKYGDIVWASVENEDDYTMVANGTIKIADKYGTITTHKLSITYSTEYDEESESGYKISAMARISEQPI